MTSCCILVYNISALLKKKYCSQIVYTLNVLLFNKKI